MEIERKFKVANDLWRKEEVVSYQRIVQFYLDEGEKYHTRVRIITAMNLSKTAFMTIKENEAKLEREEYEMEIPVSYAEEMLSKSFEMQRKERLILKSDKSVILSIDIFKDEDPLCEVEYKVDKILDIDAIELPSWIGEEVTNKPKYYSINN